MESFPALPARLPHRGVPPSSRRGLRDQGGPATGRELPTNLAFDGSSFVGRHAELADLAGLARVGDALVTLTGAAGVGKTRLARRHAAAVSARATCPGGVWFCDLADTTNAHQIAAVVAHALSIPLSSEADANEQIGAALAARGAVLVILDNFEHVLAHAAATVGRWAEHASQARFLVTSREPLGLHGESIVTLSPLSESEGVELFFDRAKAVRSDLPDAELDRQFARAVVRQVDGIPLAIELAAARAEVMSIAELSSRLARGLDILRSSRRDLPARHVTLQRAIEWSWKLLDEAERTALLQCTAFRGGFTLAAAEKVLAASGVPDSLEVVHALCRKSLLRAYAPAPFPGELRFALLDSVRRSLEEHADVAARAVSEERHAAYYVELAESLARGILGPDGATSLARLVLEVDNVALACTRSLESSPVLAARAVVALRPVLVYRGPLASFACLLDTVASRVDALGDDALAARVLAVCAEARLLSGRQGEARNDATRSKELASRSGDKGALADALLVLGEAERAHARAAEADESYGAALLLARQMGDRHREAQALSCLGRLSHGSGAIHRSRPYYARALELFRQLRDRFGEARALGDLGRITRATGSAAEVRALFGAALVIHREIGDRSAEGVVLGGLGNLFLEEGELDRALAFLTDALAVDREVGSRRLEAAELLDLALVRLDRCELDLAERLVRTAIHILDDLNDQRGLVFAFICRGAVEAAQSRATEAQASFEDARRSMKTLGSSRWAGVLGVFEGLLDLALARQARSAGDARSAHAHREAAARRSVEPRRKPSPDAPAAATRDSALRTALRILNLAIARDQRDSSLARAPLPGDSEGALMLGPAARWIRLPSGKRIDLGRRYVLRRIVVALAAQKRLDPTEPVQGKTLLAAGWPNEPTESDAAKQRLYVAIATLRKMGLSDVLRTVGDGYLFEPSIPVVGLDTGATLEELLGGLRTPAAR